MIIDFKNTEESVINNFYDGEGFIAAKMYNDDKNRILYGRLEPGCSIGMHRHEDNSEIIYFLKGKDTALFDDDKEEVSEGMCHYCPKGHSHSLINDGKEDLIFFAVVPRQ